MAKKKSGGGAFLFGALLGGAAAAAAALWNSPQSGEQTRQMLTEKLENTLFTVLGAGEATIARVWTPERPEPLADPIDPVNLTQ
ncbi:MAG: YtxH domain-containing protein [Thermomicrobiales bacterium]|nr:YtxH domain-containing protein [Thermomicrobiales bacterium]